MENETNLLEQILAKLEQQEERFQQLEQDIKKQKKELLMAMVRSMPRSNLRFEVALAEHCNLNCAGCSHFSPVAEPEFADLETVTQDFNRLSDLFGEDVGEIHLMGGEPLLHPDVIQFFPAARTAFPKARILLVTNAILLLKQPEEFWISCRENRIVITPTFYPISLDFEAIESRAKQYGIKYNCFRSLDGVEGDTVTAMNRYYLDPDSDGSGSNNFLQCGQANQCITLYKGYLYPCPTAIYARHLNRYFDEPFVLSPKDSIDIYRAESREEILEFLSRPIPFCRYCRVSKWQYGIPWSYSKKERGEWMI